MCFERWWNQWSSRCWCFFQVELKVNKKASVRHARESLSLSFPAQFRSRGGNFPYFFKLCNREEKKFLKIRISLSLFPSLSLDSWYFKTQHQVTNMPSKFYVNDCPERLKKVRDLLHLLSHEGRSVPGVSPTIDPDVKPPWFDQELFLRGQSFSQKYTVR